MSDTYIGKVCSLCGVLVKGPRVEVREMNGVTVGPWRFVYCPADGEQVITALSKLAREAMSTAGGVSPVRRIRKPSAGVEQDGGSGRKRSGMER